MSTTVRPEISKHNEMHISKHRYYELKHFCMQYPEWQKKCRYFKTSSVIDINAVPLDDDWIVYKDQIDLVDTCIREAADEWLRPFLKCSVIFGESYTKLKTGRNIPCCKETFYAAYRKFFYILSKRR